MKYKINNNILQIFNKVLILNLIMFCLFILGGNNNAIFQISDIFILLKNLGAVMTIFMVYNQYNTSAAI